MIKSIKVWWFIKEEGQEFKICVLIGSCYNPILNKYLVRAPVLPFLYEYYVNDLCLVCICHRRRAIFSNGYGVYDCRTII